MREICTHVDINADASLVWDILTDFSAYRRWNPLLRTILGSAHRGSRILITQYRAAGEPDRTKRGATTTVHRIVKHVREPRELYWLGTWLLASLLATERRFRIESLARGGVRFHHSERFRGFLVPFVWPALRRDLIPAFNCMNTALKARAERADAALTSARTSLPH